MIAYDVARHAAQQWSSFALIGFVACGAVALAALVALAVKRYNNRQFEKDMHRAGIDI